MSSRLLTFLCNLSPQIVYSLPVFLDILLLNINKLVSTYCRCKQLMICEITSPNIDVHGLT